MAEMIKILKSGKLYRTYEDLLSNAIERLDKVVKSESDWDILETDIVRKSNSSGGWVEGTITFVRRKPSPKRIKNGT